MKVSTLVQEKNVVLTDGAWGTEIAKHGFDPGICPELFNIDAPDMIRDIGVRYVEAGSEILLTNTFGGNPQKLGKYDLEDRLEELNEAGVRRSIEASGGRALVLGSIGPTGEFLAPLGRLTEGEMIASFARQAKALVQAGADAVLIESMFDLGEMKCALRAVQETTDLEIVCTMTFDRGQTGYATMMGITPEQAAAELEARGAAVVGANCSSGIEDMIGIARAMRPATGLPLWFKPNAGIPELVAGKTVYSETPEVTASFIPALIEAGASFVGGCCGTTPVHIRKMREVIDIL